MNQLNRIPVKQNAVTVKNQKINITIKVNKKHTRTITQVCLCIHFLYSYTFSGRFSKLTESYNYNLIKSLFKPDQNR